MTSKHIKALTTTAIVATLYTAITLALGAFSFGMIQIRIAEAFTILAVYSPVGIWAVTFSCFISNLLGFFTGANILGFADVIFGTFATGLAAWMSYKLRDIRWRKLPILSTLPPVLLNALIIGGELTLLETGGLTRTGVFAVNALYVGLGQAISCVVLGLGLFRLLERTGLGEKHLRL